MEIKNDRPVYEVEEYVEVPDKTTARDFSIGLALGLVAGTLGGLLLAPKSGDALRDDIQGQADKITKNLSVDESDIQELKRKAEQTTTQLREKLNDRKQDRDVPDKLAQAALEETHNDESINKTDDFTDLQTEDTKVVDMKQYDSTFSKDKKE